MVFEVGMRRGVIGLLLAVMLACVVSPGWAQIITNRNGPQGDGFMNPPEHQWRGSGSPAFGQERGSEGFGRQGYGHQDYGYQNYGREGYGREGYRRQDYDRSGGFYGSGRYGDRPPFYSPQYGDERTYRGDYGRGEYDGRSQGYDRGFRDQSGGYRDYGRQFFVSPHGSGGRFRD